MNMNLTYNQRLQLAGVKTIYQADGKVFLSRNGVIVRRPRDPEGSVETCLKVFNVVV